jgi:hypothetical protein
MSEETTAGTEETGPEAPAVTDPRPATQIEAEEGARDGVEPFDASLRAGDIASAQAYAEDGIVGAPGSEVPYDGDPPAVSQPEGVRPASQAEAEAAPPEDETTGEETGEPA